MVETPLIEAIAASFIESAKGDHFNGVVASGLLRLQESPEALRESLSELVRAGQVTVICSRYELNIHIKRLPDHSVENQLKYLREEPINEICIYPTATVIKSRVNLHEWQERPFSKMLLLAEPQLRFRGFDMGALDRYMADPRYIVSFNDYMGYMSINDDSFRSEKHPERDKVSLQSFGLGFDEAENPYIVVYLRYLTNLSPEHQQYWNSYLADVRVRMTEPYYKSSIEGNFWDNHSVRHAIIEEIRLIRELTSAIWGRSLFRPLSDENVPIDLTSFLRPTMENFNRFVMALDKLLSENIDSKFFDGKIPLESETQRPDGRIVVQRKGTLTLLEEWLLHEIIWSDTDAFRKVVIKPLREVRRLRQAPAHNFTKDNFSAEYHDKRKRLLWDIYNSLSNMRATFAKHPRAGHIEIPDWLDNGRIDVF